MQAPVARIHDSRPPRGADRTLAAQSQRQNRPQSTGVQFPEPFPKPDPMTGSSPRQVEMTQFPVVDDCLQIGGTPLPRLADRVGSTPFYAYDRKLISDRVALLRRHLPSGVEL